MKKLIVLITVLILTIAIVLPGCASQPPATTAPAAPKPATTSAAPAAVIQWRLHTEDVVGSPEVAAYNILAEGVKKDSGGRLVITVYPGGSLGFEAASILPVLQTGSLDMCAVQGTWFEGTEPLFGITGLPYIGATPAEKMVYLKALAPFYDTVLAKHNIKRLNQWGEGTNSLIARRGAATVDQWKGLKLRSWSPTIAGIYEAMGATAVSMTKSEVYTGIQMGTIDGLIYPALDVLDLKLYEVAKYYSLWRVASAYKMLNVNTAAFNKLPKDVQDMLLKYAAQAEEYCWKNVFAVDEVSLAKLKAGGTNIVEVSPAEIDKAAKATSKIWDQWLAKSGADGLAALNAALKAIGRPAYK